MDGLYRGAPEAAKFHTNYKKLADGVENGSKNSKSVIVAFPGTRYRSLVERLSPAERGALKEFDRVLFLSVAEQIVDLFRSVSPHERSQLSRQREEEFREATLGYCSIAVSRIVNPHMVETLLDPRPMCHHQMREGSRLLDVKRLQNCVLTSIDRMVTAHYTDVKQFRTEGLTPQKATLTSLRRFKSKGVQQAVLHKVNTTNWVAEGRNAMSKVDAA